MASTMSSHMVLSRANLPYHEAVALRDMNFFRSLLWNTDDRLRQAADLFRLAGDIYVQDASLCRSSFSAAADSYSNAVNLYVNLPDFGRTRDAISLLIGVYSDLKDYDNYVATLEKAIELYEANNHPEAYGCLLELADHKQMHDSNESAMTVYKRAATTARTMGSPHHAVTALNKIVEMAVSLEDYPSAAAAYEDLADIHNPVDVLFDRDVFGSILCYMADTNYDRAAYAAEMIKNERMRLLVRDLVRSAEKCDREEFSRVANELEEVVGYDSTHLIMLLRIKVDLRDPA